MNICDPAGIEHKCFFLFFFIFSILKECSSHNSSNSKSYVRFFHSFIDDTFWFGFNFDEPLSSSVFGQGSRDNMSVVLVCFVSAPKVSPEAVRREAELDKYLESRVEGMS